MGAGVTPAQGGAEPTAGSAFNQVNVLSERAATAAWRRFSLVSVEARVVGRDAFRALPSFCNCCDVAVLVLVGMFMGKFEAQRRLIANAFLLFLAACIGLERCLDIPPVEWRVKIIECARMLSHRAKDRRDQEIPSYKHEQRRGVTGIHRY